MNLRGAPLSAVPNAFAGCQRFEAGTTKPGHDVAIVCRGGIEEMPDLAAAQTTLQQILGRTDLLKPGATAPTVGAPIITSWKRGSTEKVNGEQDETANFGNDSFLQKADFAGAASLMSVSAHVLGIRLRVRREVRYL